MRNIAYTLFLIVCFVCSSSRLFAQRQAQLQLIQQRLDDLAETVPGLKQNVQLQMSGVPLRDYLSALARANKLSISVDPQLNVTVSETITNVSAENVLYFFADKYNLDLKTVGSIIYITPYNVPLSVAVPVVKDIKAKYNRLENS